MIENLPIVKKQKLNQEPIIEALMGTKEDVLL
jgi:hypothetical protein